MRSILITGAGGMLGHDLVRRFALTRSTEDVRALDRRALDITDADAVADAVDGVDAVVNLAAYTRVDDAEDDEDAAYAINATGAGHVADACARAGARLVHLSTDYVFDGLATSPYPEDAPLDPVSAYGRTKAAGERAVREAHPNGSIVLRTAWLYGEDGPNFVSTMLRLAEADAPVRVVDDQIGQPTWSSDVAEKIDELLDSPVRAGTLHATSSGSTSWYGFAQRIFVESGYDPARVEPIDSAQFARRATRPQYSVLAHGAWREIGIAPIRDWRVALADALEARKVD